MERHLLGSLFGRTFADGGGHFDEAWSISDSLGVVDGSSQANKVTVAVRDLRFNGNQTC
jgi:hypothetical protein